MKNISIRPLIDADYPDVFALWKSSENISLRKKDDSLEGFERFLRRNPDTCFAAEENEQLVGVILCGSDGRRAIIYHLCVSKNKRRNGIGRILTDKVLTSLKALGITKVYITADKDSVAEKFWISEGFIQRTDFIWMEKFLITEGNEKI